MPGMDGLALQEELARRKDNLPVIVMTGHGDVPLAVKAMRAGAIDFLEKPFDEDALVASVRRALEQRSQSLSRDIAAQAAREQLALLTEREHQVLDLLVVGKPNKVIAYELDISPRTVEIHRARVMGEDASPQSCRPRCTPHNGGQGRGNEDFPKSCIVTQLTF